MKKIVNIVLIGLGFFFTGLGAVGIILPLLPSTPFFILAVLCFAKGSTRFHDWFMGTRLYKKYVEPAVTKKEMGKAPKRKALGMLCLIFTVSFVLVPFWHARLAIAVVAAFHIYYFIFKIKTVPEKNSESVME